MRIKYRDSIVREVGERFVKAFLDVVVGLSLTGEKPVSGYSIIEHIYEVFNVLIAPSVLYPTLHSMLRRGLITKQMTSNRTGVYMLTPKGEAWLKEMVEALSNIRYSIALLTGDWEKTLKFTSIFSVLVPHNIEEETRVRYPLLTASKS